MSQGREFNPINPLVDLYNSVSLYYAVPCGEEDLAKIVGDFLEEHEVMNPSSTRGWKWCSCLSWWNDLFWRTRCGLSVFKLEWSPKNQNKDAILVIEVIKEEQASRDREAMLELHTKIEEYFGVSGMISHFTATNPILEVE